MQVTVITTVVFLTLVGLAAAEAKADGYGAPHPAPCPTHFVTKYENVIKEIPVRHTVFRTKLVPTEVYQPRFKEVYKTVVKNQYLPKYVTTTDLVNQVQLVTDYQKVTETAYQTVLVTQTQVIPTVITETEFNTLIRTNVDYRTQYETQFVPTYITSTEVQVLTKYLTNVVPDIKTVVRTVNNYMTVCPKVKHGYGY